MVLWLRVLLTGLVMLLLHQLRLQQTCSRCRRRRRPGRRCRPKSRLMMGMLLVMLMSMAYMLISLMIDDDAVHQTTS